MDLLQALIMGIVQGVTEWLPVSSSGHLVIVQKLLGVSSSENLVFDLVVHLGTLFAVIAYFRNELGRIVMSVLAFRSRNSSEDVQRRMLALMLLIGTIPAAVAGVAFKEEIEQAFDVRLVGFALLVNALILFIAYEKGSLGQRKNAKLVDAIIIGIFQAIRDHPRNIEERVHYRGRHAPGAGARDRCRVRIPSLNPHTRGSVRIRYGHPEQVRRHPCHIGGGVRGCLRRGAHINKVPSESSQIRKTVGVQRVLPCGRGDGRCFDLAVR